MGRQDLAMNIFYLDSDANVAAKYHLDKHVVKMILESAQILCTTHRVLDGTQTKIKKVTKTGKTREVNSFILSNSDKDSLLYSATHINHPCTIWSRESINNYMWLYQLFIELCDEYTYRYSKKHKTDILLRDALKNPPKNMSSLDFTKPAQAMPDEYKCSDAVQAYRTYYMKDKRKFAKWTKRETPHWFI